MAHQPILRPDDSEKPGAGLPLLRDPANAETNYPLIELTKTLAAHGAGVSSADLALDLILNDIVEQACIATGATGAAVALLRGEEMVCRAATGPAAPGLGVRLDIRSGLSGACVQEQALQSCTDAENDSRVDREACRQAGIRSILVLPLMDGGELFGIIELFSPAPHAFGELDIITLKALAHQVVENRKRADETTDKLESGGIEVAPISTQAEEAIRAEAPGSTAGHISPPPLDGVKPQDAIGKRGTATSHVDFWTAFLTVLVIGAAIFMGTLAAWRLAVRGSGVAHSRAVARRPSARPPSLAASKGELNAESGNVAGSAKPANTSKPASDQAQGAMQSGSASSSTPAPGAKETVAKRKTVARSRVPAEPPPGGLVVYEQGKLIYRIDPSSTPEVTAQQQPSNRDAVVLAGQISPEIKPVAEEVAAARLIHRVEPEYPLAARAAGVQGPVVLAAQISPEGMVQQLSVVKGDPALAPAAVEAVKQWRYQPFMVDGRPVGMRTNVTVRFSLSSN